MPLRDEDLHYAKRRAGMDQDRHGWHPISDSNPPTLSNGAKAMAFIVVPIEFFPLNPPTSPFLHPGAMKTPYPDLRHYTTRDYGNRVGVARVLRALDAAGLRATFAVNALVAERYPPLLRAIEDGGYEIAAHGWSTASLHHDGLSEDEERALVQKVRELLPQATTWMSPARNQSYRTLDLIAEQGFKICLDWESYQRPFALTTAHGKVTGLPLMNELDDFKLLIDRRQHEDAWAEQIIEAANFHVADHDRYGAQAFGFTLTPHIVGQPFRIQTVKRVLQQLAETDGLQVAPAQDVASAFSEPDQSAAQ
ncbi:MAG: polysaccharide deacetylase family protein [Pseudomonadota bacterium]